jgi:hypothetical protein
MKPDVKSASIVLLGNFNPSIFHPQWFAAHGVISQSEADDESDLKIATPQVTSFSLTWGNVQVTSDQFVISCKNPSLFTMLQDFVLKTFDILGHTPVSSMGINLEQKWLSTNKAEHQSFGDKIVPKKKWDFMSKPGLRDIVMEEQQRPDDYSGYVQARIQALREKQYSVLISINDHYFIPKYETSLGAEPIMEILRENWTTSKERSETIIKHVIENFS